MNIKQIKFGIPIYNDGGPDILIPTLIESNSGFASGECLTINGWHSSYRIETLPDVGWEHIKIRDFRPATMNDLKHQLSLSGTSMDEFISRWRMMFPYIQEKRKAIEFIMG